MRTAESVVLTLCPPGPDERNTSIRRSFSSIVHVDLLGLGHHQDASGGGVDAALRLGDRHPLDAVHAALELEQRVRRLAWFRGALGLDRDGRALDSAEVARGLVEHLDLPAAALGVAAVHAQQVAGEQRRLLAALAGLDLQDRVLEVGLGPRHEQMAQSLLELEPVRVEPGRPRRRTTRPRRRARARPRCRRWSTATPGRPGRPRVRAAVPLVELAGLHRVGEHIGGGELLLDRGVLVDEPVNCFEHRSPSCLVRR